MVSKTILRIALIICLSSSLIGCITTSRTTWVMPSKPKLAPVSFIEQKDGFFMESKDATNLANNVDEIKAYNKKLELLVNEMAKFYKIKLEEQKVESK